MTENKPQGFDIKKYKFLLPVIILLGMFALKYFLARKKSAPTTEPLATPPPQQQIPTNAMLIDLDQINPYHEMSEEKRNAFGGIYEKMFETKKWSQEVPAIPTRPDWLVTPMPSTSNVPIKIKVEKEKAQRSVEVLYDPYGVMTGKDTPHWLILADDMAPYSVPQNDTIVLSDVIDSALNHVFPNKKRQATASPTPPRPTAPQPPLEKTPQAPPVKIPTVEKIETIDPLAPLEEIKRPSSPSA